MKLFDELTRCRAWIEAALEYTNGTHTFDDIAAGVYFGRYHLLAKERGCVVLEIYEYPRSKALNVFLGAGDLSEIFAHMEELDNIARNLGASEITMTGRFGWGRVLSKAGWQRATITMRKVL